MGKQILSAGKAQLFKDSPALMISDVESTGSVDSSRECMFTVPETNATSPETESPGTQTFSDDEPSPNRTPLLSIAMVHDDCTPRTQPRSRFGEREGRVHSMLPPPQQHLRPTPAIKRGLSTPAAGAVKKPGVTFLDGFFEKVTSSPRPRMARTPTLEPLADMLSEVHKSAATISKLQRENRELTAQLHAERAVTQHLVEAQANNAFQARSMFTFAEWKCRDAVLQQEIAAFRAILSRFDNDREYCRSHSRSSMAGTHPVPAEMHHGDEAIAELTRIVGQAAAHGASVRSHQTEFTISELETQLLTAHGELRRKDVEIRGLEREIDTMKKRTC
ncbi:hypothetical protein DIPPA_05389 [Diplonema papillatum]|nr:hypothetical protein DIPPA_05389 [Diplonema papillatum]